MSKSLLNSIKEAGRQRDDTIYCNTEQFKHLKSVVGAGIISSRSVDSVMIDNMKVEEIPDLDTVIVCRKGDVFPLAKDWKNGR